MSTTKLEFELTILGSISEEVGDAANDANNDAEPAEGSADDENDGSLFQAVLPALVAIILGDDEPEEEETSLWLTNASVETEFDEQGRPTSVVSDSSVQYVTGKPSQLPEVGHHIRISIGYYEAESAEAGTPLVASVSVETSLVQEEEAVEGEEVELEPGAEGGHESASERAPEPAGE